MEARSFGDVYATRDVWESFRADSYHSLRVVWGREVNLLLLGLARQIRRVTETPAARSVAAGAAGAVGAVVGAGGPWCAALVPTTVAAKLAIADELGLPLTKLSPDDRAFIDHVLGETRMRRLVLRRIRDHFRAPSSGEDHAG